MVSVVPAWLASSPAAVLASTGANAVPPTGENNESADRTCSLSLVKSVTTCSDELMVATATRSAGDIRSSTHFTAPSTAFCTSSGCIEAVSKTSVTRRCPATSSELKGGKAAASAGFATPAGFAGATTRADADVPLFPRIAPETGAPPDVVSNANVMIRCRTPSSSNSKSSAVRPVTGAPALSRTTTSTSTRFTLL